MTVVDLRLRVDTKEERCEAASCEIIEVLSKHNCSIEDWEEIQCKLSAYAKCSCLINPPDPEQP